jgi:transcriptional regulator
MYSLPHYQEKDREKALFFIRQYPFGMLMAVDSNAKPVATQLPFLLKEREGKWFLCAHIMKGTDHHQALLQHNEVLVVFTGPHSYVSASWYSRQQQASTWNYMSVHARGELRFLDETDLLDMLEELTTHFEKNPDSPSSYKNLPDEYINRLTKAIVAFEIPIQSIDFIAKLSQNRDQVSYENIIQQLAKGDADAQAISKEMLARKDQLFPL